MFKLKRFLKRAVALLFPRKWLFLDDVRNPPRRLNRIFDVVRNYEEFVEYIETYGVPELISFDHDLHLEHTVYFFDNGGFVNPPDPRYVIFVNKTGYDCAVWLLDYCDRTGKDLKQVVVHSHNPFGQRNIFNLICNYQNIRYNNINCRILKWDNLE